FTLITGSSATVGERIIADTRRPLISATGSCQMGHRVAETVHRRLGRTIMELGGNNAVLVAPSANLDLALRAIFFGAIGTAGQRCTSTRRVIVQESIQGVLTERLIAAYKTVRIGNPLEPDTVMGPLIDGQAVEVMRQAMASL